ncbi:MAG TPA: DUF1003 domain-containing protein [Armatimonadota bacterium]|nr:DUF1003 domain-containing protein [Armatimonadota bacterium]
MSDLTVPPGPATLYRHDHPPVCNINDEHTRRLSTGQRIADRVAATMGGWPFIICQTVLLMAWMSVNVYFVLHRGALKSWDPYPFILLNLVLSFQAAYTGPVVMMSQNRQSEKDRLMAQHDYECNLKAEEEVRVLMQHLAHQDEILAKQNEVLAEITARLDAMQPSAPAPAQ